MLCHSSQSRSPNRMPNEEEDEDEVLIMHEVLHATASDSLRKSFKSNNHHEDLIRQSRSNSQSDQDSDAVPMVLEATDEDDAAVILVGDHLPPAHLTSDPGGQGSPKMWVTSSRASNPAVFGPQLSTIISTQVAQEGQLCLPHPFSSSLLASGALPHHSSSSSSTTGLTPLHNPDVSLSNSSNDSLPGCKKMMSFESCSLHPPKPTAPAPSIRSRPDGCRTIFVGGLPENVTEEILREVFTQIAGSITTIRLSKKNFCHIRFCLETSVDKAICISGYRMRIANKTDAPNTGKLHVDYAKARDDQYDYECRMRQQQRHKRHRERSSTQSSPGQCSDSDPGSPLMSTHFSEHDAHLLVEDIKRDDRLEKSLDVLFTWLERGECRKRNASQFYSMIQSTFSHARRLVAEKQNYDLEMDRLKQHLNQRLHQFLLIFGQIERVFVSACRQKAWDQFSKAQRKHISQWKAQLTEIRDEHLDKGILERVEEEMDLSEDEAVHDLSLEVSPPQKRRKMEEPQTSQMEELRREIEIKEQKIKVLEKILSNLETSADPLEEKEESPKVAEAEEDPDEDEEKEEVEQEVKTEDKAKLMGLLSIYLHIHPEGSDLEAMHNYVASFGLTNCMPRLEKVLNTTPSLFQKTNTDRWKFCGFG